ncbi:MAG: hypothetical protein LBK83_08025 [Treponema sp.]|nr:hypothetical protein [Treponema sp.]
MKFGRIFNREDFFNREVEEVEKVPRLEKQGEEAVRTSCRACRGSRMKIAGV